MTVYLAEKTLLAIDAALEADQGASYRQHLKTILPHINDAYSGLQKNPYRNHLGASVIGGECSRAIWYGFRWFTKPSFPGRILRLFNRGHLEEGRIIAALLTIGVRVYQQDQNGKQFKVSDVGGHFGGSGDGVGVGFPDLPVGLPALLEFKTHSNKSFLKVKSEGVKLAKPEHFVQMQIYMRKMHLSVALYGAVNKDNDELYLELIGIDVLVADMFLDRGHKIIMMQTAPNKINKSATWYQCKYCNHNEVCHKNKAPEVNCRTCYYAHPRKDGKWYCCEPKADMAFGDTPELTEDNQLKGCSEYVRL